MTEHNGKYYLQYALRVRNGKHMPMERMWQTLLLVRLFMLPIIRCLTSQVVS